MTELTACTNRDDWNEHWQNYAAAAEQNPAQRYRRRIIGKLLVRFGCTGNVRILDIGSGQGDLARDLSLEFPDAEIAGIELSSAGVDIASSKVPDARFFQIDLLENKGVPRAIQAWAEYAICSEVLEHLDDPGIFLTNAGQYLSPGAILVVTVPGGPQSEFDRHIGHRRHYTPETLRELLNSRGFEVELAATAGFPFFNLYRLAVVLRGRRLISDLNGHARWQKGLGAVMMGLFRVLFTLNVLGTGLGWQTVAVAKLNRPALRGPDR